jgi:hypothetical protein
VATSAALTLFLGSPVPAQTTSSEPQGPVTLTADHIEYDTQTGNVVADGHVVASRGSDKITADHLTGNLKTGDVQATGHVTLTQPGRTATGETLVYNYKTRVGHMSQAVATTSPWTVTGQSIATAGGRAVALQASATPCNPAHPAFLITARRVVVVPDNYLTAYDAVLRVYGVPIFWVPQYTVSLKRGHRESSTPTVGYDNFNGVWAEETFYYPLGDWDAQVDLRVGSRSGLTGDAVINRHFPGYAVTANFGRLETFDQNGNEFNLDQYTLDLQSNTYRIGKLPFLVSADVNGGHYLENETGVNTSRTEGLLTITSDIIKLTPSLILSAGGYYRYDSYGTGDLRNITAASAALTKTLTPTSSTTLSYNFATVQGTTPFLFDAIGTDSAATLSYSYYPSGKIFSSGTISGSYDWVTLQTTGTLSLTFTISPSLQFATNITYNVDTQQFSEIDYVVNETCDCAQLGVVYQTFPNAPMSNRWFITLGITTLPGIRTTFNVGGPP